jgi:hypothetical protein
MSAPPATAPLPPCTRADPAPGNAARQPRPALHLRLLTWIFVGFNSTRLLTYLPTIWAIHASGDSSQHSLLTWLAWVGANASMAAWLYENNGRRLDKAIALNLGNALLCLATTLVICAYR